jgi:four helix bundle protein
MQSVKCELQERWIEGMPRVPDTRDALRLAPAIQMKFDLEERLLDFSTRIIAVADSIKRTAAGTHIADQLMRSGTSPYGHHGEAEGAESRADFVHKLRICYKELRETRRWLRLVQRVPLIAQPQQLTALISESDELVRIFAASIRTAEANREREST